VLVKKMTASNLEQDIRPAAPGTLPSVHTVYWNLKLRTGWTTDPPKNDETPAEDASSAQHALVARYMSTSDDSSRNFYLHSVVVQSQILKTLLARVFDRYEGITLGLGKVEFSTPFEPFVRRWERLAEARDQLLAEATTDGCQQITAHFNLLRPTLYDELASILDERQDMLDHHVTTFKLV
jgi:hypothetical protein